ncbi:MAG: TonB-dependent receptor plug domain-containing protein, partial [Saprospiraceae bacterium]
MISRVLFIILIPFLLHSQNCDFELSIRVLDHHDDDGLAYATVFIQELAKGDITDNEGSVQFKLLCAGKYHIIISHIGCATQTLFVDITKSEQLTIYLEHHEELLEEVEIKSVSSQNKIGLSKSSIGKELLLELKGKNLSDVLLTVPGVSALRTGPGLAKPIIQGMYGNRVTILNHGIPQEGQQWGNDHTPEIDPNTADKISVVKGSSAIRYG